MRWEIHKGLTLCLVMVVGLWASMASAAGGTAGYPMKIKVIHASKSGNTIDPKIKKLVKGFSELKFSSYTMLDTATFKLSESRSYQMQMPNGAWMKVQLLQVMKDGAIRIQLESKKVMKFKTTAVVDAGATIAVGGPSYKAGRLIFAATRVK